MPASFKERFHEQTRRGDITGNVVSSADPFPNSIQVRREEEVASDTRVRQKIRAGGHQQSVPCNMGTQSDATSQGKGTPAWSCQPASTSWSMSSWPLCLLARTTQL